VGVRGCRRGDGVVGAWALVRRWGDESCDGVDLLLGWGSRGGVAWYGSERWMPWSTGKGKES